MGCAQADSKDHEDIYPRDRERKQCEARPGKPIPKDKPGNGSYDGVCRVDAGAAIDPADDGPVDRNTDGKDQRNDGWVGPPRRDRRSCSAMQW